MHRARCRLWPTRENVLTSIELAGITAACLGASSVLLTDLTDNLSLLKENVIKNDVLDTVSVTALEWGRQCDLLDVRTFDVILAADVMYDACVIPAFLQTLRSIATSSTRIFLAYGRNRQAEEQFLQEVGKWFSVESIGVEELDEVYRCIDVDVFVMTRHEHESDDVPMH